MVDLGADRLHLRADRVVVGDGPVVDALDAVGDPTRLGEFLDELFDALGALCNLRDELHVTRREPVGLLGREHILHALYVLDELRLVVGGDRDDMVHRQVAHHTGLYLDGFHVSLPLHLVAGFELLAVHDLRGLEHPDTGVVEVVLDDLRARLLDVETPAGSLLDPSLAVAIAVEADRLAGAYILTENVDDGRYLVVALGYLGIDPRLEVEERFGHRRVERNHCRGTVGRRARCTELEAITRKGEGRRAVAVGIVDDEVGDLRDVDLHTPLAFQIEEVILVGEFDMVEEFGELFAEERADDGRRRLVAPQTVRICGTDN